MTREQRVLSGFFRGVLLGTLLLGALCEAAPQSRAGNRQPVRLVINGIAAGQKITDHDWGFVRLEVGVEARRPPAVRKQLKQKRSALGVKIDGADAPYRLLDSRTGYEGGKAFSYRTLGVAPGSPGPHSITVLVGRRSRTIPVVFDPAGRLEIPGLCEDQAIFGKKTLDLQWFGCYLAAGSVKAWVNGREIPAEPTGADERLRLVEGRVALGGSIEPGRNTLLMEGTDIRGGRQEKSVPFYYYPDNRVTVGDAFVVSLGDQEPTGRPFFEVEVEGTSVVKGRDLSVRPGPERLGGETAPPSGKTVLSRFEAVAPGESVIRTSEKQHRADRFRERASIRLLVQTRSQAASIDKARAGGFSLKQFHMPGFFTCLVPDGWTTVRNPDEDRGIYGLSTYREGQGETGGTGLKLVVEYYPRDDDAFLPTAGDFISAMREKRPGGRGNEPVVVRDFEVAARPAKRFERDVNLAAKTLFFFTRPVPIREEYVVVPGRTGFYVLRSRAPSQETREARLLFDAMVGSFEPSR